METYKFNLNKHTQYKTILCKVNLVLAEIKKIDAEMKISKTESQKTKLIDEFKKRYKKMSDSDFNKRIDLTAPKKDRAPEIGVALWKKSKDVIFKDNTYKNSTQAQTSAFNMAFKRKKIHMDDDLKNKINNSIDDTFTKMAIIKYEPERLKYQVYNPASYRGLSYY